MDMRTLKNRVSEVAGLGSEKSMQSQPAAEWRRTLRRIQARQAVRHYSIVFKQDLFLWTDIECS